MNFFEYLAHQKLEDRQAFIIHFPPGTGKTAFAKRICELRPSVYRLDLLEAFTVHPELKIAEFTPQRLEDYVLAYPYPEGVTTVLVDNGDVLWNTWSKPQKEDLLHWMRYTLRTPSKTTMTIVLIIQTDNIWTQASLNDAGGRSRILPLNAFDAL